jgi:thioredoxin reductase (NADPH)
VLRLIASRSSGRAFEVRDLLERNLLPVRWYDVDTDAESAALLETLAIPRSETPVLIRIDGVLRNPSAAQVARTLGLRAEIDGQTFDLVVLGAGPAGLAAAVYGASEGLRTLVADAWAPGGQAGTSTRIENYLGFPSGISGTELTRKATLQARRFDAVLSSFHRAIELVDGPDGMARVDFDDGQHVVARTLLVATGAQWRTLDAEGIDRFTGAGVYHVATATNSRRCESEDVIVVGGGNSAGQAAVHLSQQARSVRMVVRRDSLAPTMSRYLLNRIDRAAGGRLPGRLARPGPPRRGHRGPWRARSRGRLRAIGRSHRPPWRRLSGASSFRLRSCPTKGTASRCYRSSRRSSPRSTDTERLAGRCVTLPQLPRRGRLNVRSAPVLDR